MQSTIESVRKPPGVIDAIQGGFDLVHRRPWLLLIPVLVDLLLWLGPKLSIAPLLAQVSKVILQQPDLPADMAELMTGSAAAMQMLGERFNLLSLLAGLLTGLPSYLSRPDAASVVHAIGSAVPINQFTQALLYALALTPLGLLVGSLWLTLLVRSLETEPPPVINSLRRGGWVWLNVGLYLIGLIIILLIGSFLLGLIMSALVLLAGGAGSFIASIMWLLMIMVALWATIGLNFVVSAIALDGVNVAQAAWRSLNVVGRNLGGTIGLLLVSQVLAEGFARIWMRLSATNDWGIPVGIAGSSYLGTALVAATLIYYRSHYQHWQRIRSTMASARRSGEESSDEVSPSPFILHPPTSDLRPPTSDLRPPSLVSRPPSHSRL